jgi:hypothetical protein
MKKIIILTFLFITLLTFAQVPQGISYQAIALNTVGAPVVSGNVGLRLSVLDNSATGTAVYTETHTKTTNTQGLFNLVIGQGTAVSGTFNTINWGTNSKFLKVEMDATGGTNYVLVGTTQLLSAPYALAADSLVTSPGEGITLVSPNGTPYQVTVNDAGQLSLPTSGVAGTSPSSLYMYGSFNGFDPTTSLLMNLYTSPDGISTVYNNAGYKYLTSGTQIKFLAENNASSTVYGLNGSLILIPNGSANTITSNGFYFLNLSHPYNNEQLTFTKASISPTLVKFLYSQGTNPSYVNPTYNSSTNTFSFILNGITTGNFTNFLFYLPRNNTFDSSGNLGDNLGDGSIDFDGTFINIPNINSTPKNFRVDLIINFNGSGTYTITQI